MYYLSVIIPCYNESENISLIFNILSLFDNDVEIVIVDNKSTDESLNIVKHFQQDPELNDKNNPQYTKINILNLDDYSPGQGINLGVKNCNNNYILVISSHCILTKIDMEKHKLDLEKHVCIFGNQIPVWMGKKIKKRYLWSHFQKNK